MSESAELEDLSPCGWIEVITGPMFSGKTVHLILRATQAQAVGQKVQIFKPKIDTRYRTDDTVSQTGLRIPTVPVESAEEILQLVEPDTKVVAVDEAQFFDMDLIEVCHGLAKRGKRVILAGLDMDFRRKPFGPIPHLLAVAETVDKLTALCAICGNPASFSQRLVEGRPAHYTDPIVLKGGSELYQPRCRAHYIAPER